MNDQLPMFDRTTSADTRSGTSSPAEASGATPSAAPDGPTRGRSPRSPARANPSVPQGRATGSRMSDTFGQKPCESSGSSGHLSSSESKSPQPSGAYMLKTRTCRLCKAEKPFSEFYANSKGAKRNACKDCDKEKERSRKHSRSSEISDEHRQWRLERRGFALVNVARHRAKAKGVPCTLDPEDIQARIDAGHCEVTGIPFDLTKPRSWNAPSLDRINPSEGYTPTNVRVILFSLNVMANVWGIQKVVEAGNAILAQRTKRSDELSESLAVALKRRLGGAGSTLFESGWKEKVTPSGRRYWEHTALARRTSASACTSVPTPQASDMTGGGQAKRAEGRSNLVDHAMLASVPSPKAQQDGRTLEQYEQGRQRGYETRKGKTKGGPSSKQGDLAIAVQLATVPTPMAGSPATETYNAAGNSDYSRRIVELASLNLAAVPTPCANEDNKSVEAHLAMKKRMGERDGTESDRKAITSLQVTAKLAAVTTPSARDWKDTSGMSESGVDPDGSTRSRLDQLLRQAQLAASGETATGGTAATGSSGQLDPAYSRWLMGVPPEWDGFACSATELLSRSRKRSSKRPPR